MMMGVMAMMVLDECRQAVLLCTAMSEKPTPMKGPGENGYEHGSQALALMQAGDHASGVSADYEPCGEAGQARHAANGVRGKGRTASCWVASEE